MIGAIAFAHGDDASLKARLRPYQIKALNDIATCGTEACGMHREACDHCGDRRMVPNTCQNRHCPHCQGNKRAQWVAARTDELLPCDYLHAVFTLPPELRGISAAFPSIMLGSLLQSASDSVDYLCRDPRYLGAEVGQLAVLHTWKRDLGWHPHAHVIITAGGWNAEQKRWIPAKRFGEQRTTFLLPKDLLCTAFQHRLRRLLLKAYKNGSFQDGPHEAFPELTTFIRFRASLNRSMKKPWVIRIEPPFAGPKPLLKYLGAYVNRVAITPQRILAHDPVAGTVTYGWSTNAEPNKPQQTTIPATEFLRRFAQHILPPHFQRIRFRGLWSTAHRATKLNVARQALCGMTPPSPPSTPPPPPPPHERNRCPICGNGHYHRIPGPCPRPTRTERGKILKRLRKTGNSQTPTETKIPA
jgi:hypothetical protein